MSGLVNWVNIVLRQVGFVNLKSATSNIIDMNGADSILDSIKII